jgi:hypothetical protein
MIKKCIKCLKEKTIDCFNVCLSHKDGTQSLCKECQSNYYRNYYEKRKEKIKEKVKKWREAKK